MPLEDEAPDAADQIAVPGDGDARAAGDNAGSLRVLEKAGFQIIGTEMSYATARGTEIEETILRLS